MHYTKDMNIYLSGIGGVGIGPLAEIARDAGYRVQGSDANSSLVTAKLKNSGITISTDQTGTFLEKCHHEQPLDWFVHTAALPDSHPELIRARELGIRTAKRDELLNAIINDKHLKLIAVAGTHGKTTTTGMLVWAMKQLGIPVSYSVGTTLSFGPSGAFDPSSKYFVYECDEFDRNFLHFNPELSLVTSIDYDHPDTYPTKDDYTAAFRAFLHQSSASVLWQHDADYIAAHEPSAWHLQDNEVAKFMLAGAHNRRNATLVLKGLERLGLASHAEASVALDSFPGTDRRFERLAEGLYTDYGHHPVEIAATLAMAHELSDHVVLVYQPHQNTRQHEIRSQYTDEVFKDADEIYWLPTYLSRENPDYEILSPEKLTERLNNTMVHISDLDDTLWDSVSKARKNGALVLGMGAGSIDAWLRAKLESDAS